MKVLILFYPGPYDPHINEERESYRPLYESNLGLHLTPSLLTL